MEWSGCGRRERLERRGEALTGQREPWAGATGAARRNLGLSHTSLFAFEASKLLK